MATFKDAEGNDVEALTTAEVEAKLAEQKTEFETKMGESTKAAETAIAERDQAKKDLEAAQAGGDTEGSKNFKVLKDALDKKNEKVTELETAVATERNQRVEDYKNAAMEKLTGGDVELKKKIEHHFSETLKGVKADKPEEVLAKLQNALKLSVDHNSPNAMDIAMGGSGRGADIDVKAGSLEFSSKEKSLGNKMGIADADYKKYADDPRLKRMAK